MLRITIDNAVLNNRIGKAHAFYRKDDWMNHAQAHKKILQMRCEYPLIIEKPLDSNDTPISQTGYGKFAFASTSSGFRNASESDFAREKNQSGLTEGRSLQETASLDKKGSKSFKINKRVGALPHAASEGVLLKNRTGSQSNRQRHPETEGGSSIPFSTMSGNEIMISDPNSVQVPTLLAHDASGHRGHDASMQGSSSPPKPAPQSNSVLMARHFLKEDIILIYEDVVQIKRHFFHCSMTKGVQ